MNQRFPILRSRPGFTLIELLVVIAVMSILMSLLLSAVHATREAGRRITCLSNLRQIGIALFHYNSTHQSFPAGTQLSTTNSPQKGMGLSWIIETLPQIEEGNLYDKLDRYCDNAGSLQTRSSNGDLVDRYEISLMRCPSSPIPSLKAFGPYEVFMPSYVGISGAADGGGFQENRVSSLMGGQISGGGILVPNRSICSAGISDGMSNTLLVGEISNYAYDSRGRNRRVDGGYDFGWLAGSAATGTPPQYNSEKPMFPPPSYNITTIRYPIGEQNFDLPGVNRSHGPNSPLLSAHSAGASVVFADGSARLLSTDTDVLTLKRLATRDDGELPRE